MLTADEIVRYGHETERERLLIERIEELQDEIDFIILKLNISDDEKLVEP